MHPSATIVSTPPTEQVIGYHGVLVTVPESWGINETVCGTPVKDTVVRDQGAVASCLTQRPPGVSSVAFIDRPAYWLPRFHRRSARTNAHGVRIELGSASDLGGVVAYIPTAHLMVSVDTTSSGLTSTILDSVAISDMDPNGCAMRAGRLTPPPGAGADVPGAHGTLLPGVPTTITICRYADRWLASSAALVGSGMTQLAGAIDGVPKGSVYAPPQDYLHAICRKSSAAGGERGSGYILHIEGTGTPAGLWAHVGICGPLGISNGVRNGQLTRQLAAALNKPLHHGYEMPGRFVVRANA